MSFYCYLTSAAAAWLIGRQPHRGHSGGEMGWCCFVSIWFCPVVLEQGELRDPQRRVCSSLLCAVNTAECSGFLQSSTMAPSHLAVRLQTTGQSWSLHIYQLQTAYRQSLAYSAKYPHLIIESVLVPHCAPHGSSARKMAAEKTTWFAAGRYCRDLVLCLCSSPAIILLNISVIH